MISKLNKCFKGVDKTPFFFNTYRVLSIIFIMYSDLYETPEDITREALSWFTCYTGTFHRLQKRTKAEAKRALIVFCSLALFEDYRDIKPVIRRHFVDLFMASNTDNKLTKRELKAGKIESKEILEYYE